jgi:hypothetical protein
VTKNRFFFTSQNPPIFVLNFLQSNLQMNKAYFIAAIGLSIMTSAAAQKPSSTLFRQPIRIESQYTTTFKSSALTEAPLFASTSSERTSWRELVCAPTADKQETELVMTVKRMKVSSTSRGEIINVDTDAPFTNNPKEEREMERLQETMKKPIHQTLRTTGTGKSAPGKLSASSRLPFCRFPASNGIILDYVANSRQWADTLLSEEGEVYVSTFSVVGQDENSAKINVSGTLITDSSQLRQITSTVAPNTTLTIGSMYEKDVYSGTLLVDMASGLIQSGQLTRRQEQFVKMGEAGSRIAIDVTYKIENKRL